MTNAELFKKTFGIYSEEFWSYTEKQMLDWINADVPDTNVGDMISRQAAIDAVCKCTNYFIGNLPTMINKDDAYKALHEVPSENVQPVKHGYWIVPHFGDDARCSECGMYFSDVYDLEDSDRYCRHCGARMEGLRNG